MSDRLYTEGYNTESGGSLTRRLKTLFEEDGIIGVGAGLYRFLVWRYLQWVKWPIEYRWYRAFKGDRTFQFGDAELRYCVQRSNRTWNSERAIEVPIAFHILEDVREDEQVLEVGNVLRQYQEQYRDVSHRVVDKYEAGEEIENVDIVDYNPEAEFDLILSISTLEHVGFDEEDGDPEKFTTAIASLTDLLAPGGRLVFTVPLGYNEVMDAALESGEVRLDEAKYYRRETSDNVWSEMSPSAAGELEYGEKHPHANELLIGMIVNR